MRDATPCNIVRMPAPPVTRFAPSPSGELHLGNVRTALFSLLLARRGGGRFVLRIEDTDAARSTEAHTQALEQELRWLGLDWDEGPGRPGAAGPYRQSERAAVYAPLLAQLEQRDLAYPCFCSAAELELSRRAQLGAGRPPRYAGTCASLDQGQRAARFATGARASLRFRVPVTRLLRFDDLVHAQQQFDCAHIGDFVIRREDGTPAFFFANAIDDSLMQVTQVLRGDDHLANTPRQILVLEALQMRVPGYGHLPLLTGDDGAPLSKRNGARSLRELREAGYSALAILNHLFRLGHSGATQELLTLEAMAAQFDPAHLQRASAHFDMAQLRHWQGQWVHALKPEAALQWLSARLPGEASAAQRLAFVTAVLPNLVAASDVESWLPVVFGGELAFEEPARAAIQAAGPGFFVAAAGAVPEPGATATSVELAALRAATGRKGVEFFAPLRAALTGRLHGPELAPLLRAMSAALLKTRLLAAYRS
jgi:glutamyl-tRNA synthetase